MGVAETGVEPVVYALHDFEAENIDELSFSQGEKIVVLQDDSAYSDGWYEVSVALRADLGGGLLSS